MRKLNGQVTDTTRFFEQWNPFDLARQFGTPLYVYNERILRQNCREFMNFTRYPHFTVQFSIKANSSLALLQIVREEGLGMDAMSPGEMYAGQKAGFAPEQIFYICNNVSEDEMRYAIENRITVSVDSLSQLEQFGRINMGGSVAVRINSGVGAGHHEKVMTAGKNTKFGVSMEDIPEAVRLLQKYKLRLIGINQHIGSLFMNGDVYLQSMRSVFDAAMRFREAGFDSLEFIDFGGGFGMPYQKQNGEVRLDLKSLGEKMDVLMESFVKEYGKALTFKVEPGRYVTAEAGVLLGMVHAIKNNGEKKYMGTDVGMNVLIRPCMYDSHHDIEVYRNNDAPLSAEEAAFEEVTVVGNICETGDILARDRLLPKAAEGDLIGVLDAGSYGHVMSSNYNNRLRPAEVLIRESGEAVLIRERDTLEDLVRKFILLGDL